ncbi:hypothetical protein BHE74_00047909, partial [Ensete ventricosum]
NDFRDYAEICFKEFGDRVKHWITLNEPWTYCRSGYSTGTFAPGRCSPWADGKCTEGDSAREPYLCAHYQLLSHAAAVKLYRRKYQDGLLHKILIEDLCELWCRFMDPLTQGDYPFTMRAIVGHRLPKFNAEQSKMVQGSFDFIGLNYYTTYFADSISLLKRLNASYDSDSHTLQSGKQAHDLFVVSDEQILVISYACAVSVVVSFHLKQVSGEGFPSALSLNRHVLLLLLGVDEVNNASWPLSKALQDDMRIDYYKNHLHFVEKAIRYKTEASSGGVVCIDREGVDVRGYFAWSLLDNFEWTNGYTVRFGIVYVDYRNGLKRYPKTSAHWFREVLNN